jgi:flavodoxin I
MKAAILVESLTGNTWKAGEMIAGQLQQAGWGITALSRVRQPDYAALQAADVVLVGTWIHGLFVVGQAPWALGELAKLPAMKDKLAAAFCTYALNPGRSLHKMTGVLDSLGAEVLGGLALHRAKLPQHTEEFAARLVERVTETGV